MQKLAGPRTWIGTSGFSYKEWKGVFYPEEVPASGYLQYYSGHFPTTEINNTFYRIPSIRLTESWYDEVPPGFFFTLKLSQKITHLKRLRNTEAEMKAFLEAAAALREKLGTILVQLPPYFRKDTQVLSDFLAAYASKVRLAFEFRHDSWFQDDVYELLRKHSSAWAVVEAEDHDAIRQVTGNFIYMRLRKGDYTKKELGGWADWIRKQSVDVFCYLKHDEKAPVLAKELMKQLGI